MVGPSGVLARFDNPSPTSLRPCKSSIPVHRSVLMLMWLLLAAYLVGLALHGPDFDPLVDLWLGCLTQLVPAVVCWSALLRPGRRGQVACVAVGVSVFALGNVFYVVSASREVTLPFPSVADLGYLGFYPAALVAIVLAVRMEHRKVRAGVWLDSLLIALAAVAVLAVLLEGVYAQASGSPLAVAVAVAYPTFDLLLVGSIVAVGGLQGLQVRKHWLPLLSGLAALATADVIFALRVSTDNYAPGTLLDGLWAIGLALISVWAGLKPPETVASTTKPASLVMPAVATAAGLAVLVVASQTHVSTLAIALATLTVVVTALRTQMAFRQLRRLADLRRQATTDDLTGLPNRRALYAHIEGQLLGTRSALLLLDLDKFKEVNDGLGHHVGDQLLAQVGARLAEPLREGDMLARLGGDEYSIVLANAGRDQAAAVAKKLRRVLGDPFTVEGIVLRTQASIGIALTPDHGNDPTGLLRRADIAMYKAKRGRLGQHVFTADDDTSTRSQLRLQEEVREALAHDQLTVHYQPKLDLATRQISGVEALVRWDHPTRGLLYPHSFLSTVEEAGLMPQLTEIVLNRALDQAAVWRDRGQPLTVAVNLSATSLVDTRLPEQIGASLAARRLPADALQLEITEEFLMAERMRALEILQRLRDMGVEIAVDDFGTGYSSLAYLRELPIDELKLDRSFISPMADDARAAALVFSIIDMAHSLGVRLVAEGVESDTALRELTAHGCDQAQGYHLCRPVPAAELDHWLSEQRSGVASRSS